MGCVNCKRCGDHIDLDRKTYEFDEGMDLYFCDVECQLSFYQSEYDRIITEKETWKRDCLLLKMDLDYLVKMCEIALDMNDVDFERGMIKGALQWVKTPQESRPKVGA